MIIDFHTHMFPDPLAERTLTKLKGLTHVEPCTDGTWRGLEESTVAAGIDISIVLPPATKAGQANTINKFASQFQEGPLISFGGIHPDDENYKEILQDIKEKGLKGIKLHPDYQGTRFNDIRYKRIIEHASDLGLIVVTHAGRDPLCPEDVHCTPKMAREVIREVQPDKLVLAHFGGHQMYDEVEQYLMGEDVYFDISNTHGKLPMDQYMKIMKTHGMDRILFATDSPWRDQAESVKEVDLLPITEKEKSMLLSENAVRLLGL